MTLQEGLLVVEVTLDQAAAAAVPFVAVAVVVAEALLQFALDNSISCHFHAFKYIYQKVFFDFSGFVCLEYNTPFQSK
jgi:hypothetical protein